MKDFKQNRYSAGQKPGGFRRGGFSRPSFGGAKRDTGRPFGNTGEMHRATCSKCNAMCEVPFVPNGKKPIFCKNCYVRDDARQAPSFEKRPFNQDRRDAPERGSEDPRISTMLKEIGAMHAKMDALIKRMDAKLDAPAAPAAIESPRKRAAPKTAAKKK